MNKIKLKIKGVSEIVGTSELGILILTDELENRQLSIVCDKTTEYMFGLRLQNLPITEKLLPEVLWKEITMLSDSRFEIIIHDLIDGQYNAILNNVDTLTQIPIRASDAILLSMISQIPLYIEENLMDRQSVVYKKGSNGMAIPVNSLDEKMLESALAKAVMDENYEFASQLRDEINKRKIHKRDDSLNTNQSNPEK
jgi:bifunctional DNase/RNase